MRKTAMAVLAISLWLCLLPAAAAAENRGSIYLHLDAGDLAVTNGAVTLYQVGTRTEDGYRILEGFGGGIVREEDADSATLAQWLAESVEEAGSTMLLDADGNAVYSNLEEGLYMLVQTERMDGFYPILPILLSVPQENSWEVQIYRAPVPVVTELPKTGQTPIPYLGILGILISSTGLFLCGLKRKQ